MTTSRPAFGDPLPPCHPSDDTLALLQRRRSTQAALLGAPGPAPEQVDALLEMAARVPDHRRVVPYRFIVIGEDATAAFGDVLGQALASEKKPEKDPRALEKGMALAARAPVIVAVVARVEIDHKTPEWEQVLTVGAVCQTLLIAASAMGFAGQWLTEWIAYDPDVARALHLDAGERIAGLIYLGTATEDPKERQRPEMSDIVTRWGASA